MICTFIMIVAVIKFDLLEVMEAVNEYVSENLYAGLLAVSNEEQIIYRNEPAKKIENMALSDAMTDLLNRRAYELKLEELERNGIPDGMYYICFDVNGLKGQMTTRFKNQHK